MNENQSTFPTISALLGTGGLVAILSMLGLDWNFRPVGEESQKAKQQKSEPIANAQYPSSKGAVGYSALMWDDPFQHAEKAKNDNDLSKDTAIWKTIKAKLKENDRIMYLVIPVREGNDDYGIEKRRRTRHAVELALANQGFSLPFPDRMTYRGVEICHYLTRKSQSGDSVSTKICRAIPTKLYRHSKGNHYILVSWIQESDLGKRPLNTIQQLLTDVAPENDVKKNASLCILGPTYSNLLADIILDAANFSDQACLKNFYNGWDGGLALCNYSCTAKDLTLNLRPGQTELELGDDLRMKLIHTIGADERLLTSLKHELSIRGVWPSSNQPEDMLLFVEQSPLNYLDDLKSFFKGSDGVNSVMIPYMKGIADAEIAGAEEERRSVEDYLDRTMSRLGAYHRVESEVAAPVKLIGILGSRWEDKDLILKKARQVFPMATFFTTDLDSRYSDPNAHGRNLIIASHYGLRVEGRSDLFRSVSSVPRFRDQYQTSGFVAASILCKAFLDKKLEGKDSKFQKHFDDLSQDFFDIVGRRESDTQVPISDAYLLPCMFEVGRHGPVQLRTNYQQDIDYLPLRQPSPPPGIHERRWIIPILIVGTIASIIVFNSLVRFSADARKVKRGFTNGWKNTFHAVRYLITDRRKGTAVLALWSQLFGVVLGICILILFVASTTSVETEPVMISEGVSIWPTIVGLYLVILLSLGSLRDLLQKPDADKSTEITEKSTAIWEPKNRRKRQEDFSACKISIAIVLGFYLTSYFESGYIPPPARDWVVRWLANGLLFTATLLVVLVACRCIIYALSARKKISVYQEKINEDKPVFLADKCRSTMLMSIETSKDLVAPACLSLLFIGARSNYWDAWGLDRSWYVLISIPIMLCLIAALIVRLTAINYRNRVVDHGRSTRFHQLCGSRRERAYDKEILDLAIKEIEGLKRGPFGPLSHDYLLGAVAIFIAIVASGPLSTLFNRWVL